MSQYDQVINLLSDQNGLEDINISKDASAGHGNLLIPKDSRYALHSWFEVLILHLTGAGYPWTNRRDLPRESLWPPDLQVIGKDALKYVSRVSIRLLCVNVYMSLQILRDLLPRNLNGA